LYLLVFCTVSCYLLLMKAAVYHKHGPAQMVTPLEATVAHIPLGITVKEADALIGTAPDRVTQMNGTLINPTTMLTFPNTQATKYGVPQAYSLRTWKRDGVNATVAIDQTGKVAGRWTWSDSRPRNPNQLSFDNVLNRASKFFRLLVV
tara:strand:+ start:99860 stop:100303 length:444 start_codon:yes stop_codon:yes gene_type:complete